MIQADLFGASPPIPGLASSDELVSPQEERDLVARIDATDLTPFQFHGWTGKRLTTSFGWHYDFDRGGMAQTEPMPGWLLPIRDRAAAFAGLPADALAQALLIRYDPGAGIGWHRDRPVFGHVVGLSLGAPATMRFRKRRSGGFDRVAVPLPPRGAYLLSGEARHDWEHSIAPMEVARHSITFRSLASPR
ncbi:alpha-ketoglutarate-dependent dioxygenase AlkB [Sphingomonas aracearum]|uniref:Alpha-ketoglutarate-dependent dioxygenase AlkB n=1 Tax=Sphingomonas aracearum TaxID=2283317 RepID=A0A369VXP4_9SPHN|nr:alpha-ketoglutarate-dependent dioxygenase AlkB [Sphingomonas aracearum]RDE06609.1 alpha-ketoglutarate-dependent dioxygenase AlkB [Sphingomonas aracearum]